MLVHEFLEQSARKFPDKVALISEGKRLTYKEVDDSANSLACALIQGGLEKQGRGAVYLASSPEAVVAIFGILKAGGIFLVINPQVKAKKAQYILNDCQARVLVTDAEHLAEIKDILQGCPNLKSIILTDQENYKEQLFEAVGAQIYFYPEITKHHSSKYQDRRCIDIDLASLIYTSGSTGLPKGVMLTHLNMVSAANSITEYLGNTPDDIILDVLPLSFDYGLYQVLMSFKFGGTVVLERTFVYPYRVIDLILKERVTGFPIVPTIAAILLKLKNLDKHNFSGLRYITNTAQALPPRYIFELKKIFPGAKVFSMYGLTECKRVSYLPPEELMIRPTSVGKAIPNTEVYLVDKEGNRVTKPEEIGELVVRGANVMAGYWNLPEETERALRPGPIPGERLLYTGDLFKTDEEGFLYFIARKDDVIKVAGERVSPKEIENVLYELDDISEAAVIGVY